MPEFVVVQRLLMITVIAGFIGYERERHGRAAGLRTHLLVGVGSCLIMLTDLHLADLFGDRIHDFTRISAQVVSGIGFLGAGTILRFRASVRGLTTAASLWVVAGLGLAVGSGFMVGAVAATAIVLIALFGLSRLERVMRKDWYKMLIVDTPVSSQNLAKIREVLSKYDVEIRDFEVRQAERSDSSVVELSVRLISWRDEEPILQAVSRLEGVRRAHWA